MVKNTKVNIKNTKKRKSTIRKTRKRRFIKQKGGVVGFGLETEREALKILLDRYRNDFLSDIKDIVSRYPELLSKPIIGSNTPLHIIAKIKGGSELCSYFIDKYKSTLDTLSEKEGNTKYNEFINAKNRYDEQTALHIALLNYNFSVATVLINKDADVNSKDKNDDTPLHIIAHLYVKLYKMDDSEKKEILKNKIIDMINLLFEKGANILIENKKQYTPTDIVTMQLVEAEHEKDVVAKKLRNAQKKARRESNKVLKEDIIKKALHPSRIARRLKVKKGMEDEEDEVDLDEVLNNL